MDRASGQHNPWQTRGKRGKKGAAPAAHCVACGQRGMAAQAGELPICRNCLSNSKAHAKLEAAAAAVSAALRSDDTVLFRVHAALMDIRLLQLDAAAQAFRAGCSASTISRSDQESAKAIDDAFDQQLRDLLGSLTGDPGAAQEDGLLWVWLRKAIASKAWTRAMKLLKGSMRLILARVEQRRTVLQLLQRQPSTGAYGAMTRSTRLVSARLIGGAAHAS
jgi:hypothetical protein